MRLTTRMAHSRAVVEVATKPIPRREKLTFPKDPSSWILLPANARRKYPQVISGYEELERISASKEGWNLSLIHILFPETEGDGSHPSSRLFGACGA